MIQYRRLVPTKRGFKYWIDPRDKFVGLSLVKLGEYSENELQLLEHMVDPKKAVLVVGAHIGSFALPLSRCCPQVVAIEANPDTYALLVDNLTENNISNVAAHYCAADEVSGGQIDFLCGTVNSGGSKRMPVKMHPDYIMDDPKKVAVPTIRLDDAFGDVDFGLIHMDIEGSEVFALRGAQKLLAKTRYLSVEFIGHHLTHVAAVSVEEWLAPIAPHYENMLLPGDPKLKRPFVLIQKPDWHEMLQNILNANAGVENLVFFNGEFGV